MVLLLNNNADKSIYDNILLHTKYFNLHHLKKGKEIP